MARSVAVVVPVKDGARFLRELLEAVFAQAVDAAGLDVLVIDSGSRDGSADIARAAGARVLEIAPESFGHGRTRNLGAEHTTAELICFLTQDATPVPGWLAAYQQAFDLDPQVGAAYGPHLARPETSPMIARELEEFFAMHGPDARPVVQRVGGVTYLSNVNAAYRRDCWQAVRFPDVPYSEDQAFGAAMLRAGWAKVFHPRAAVLHAHDYPYGQFMRRYFDEYRGLREALGHVEGFGPRSSAKVAARLVRQDMRWMRDRGTPARERLAWLPRSAAHHGGRQVFSALGSRAHGLPRPMQRALSLEGTIATGNPGPLAADRPGPPRGAPVASSGRHVYDAMLEFSQHGAAPLRPTVPGLWSKQRLHIAVIIPPFRRGSGGHNSIFQMLSRLERRGQTISLWVHDPAGWMSAEWPAVARRNVGEFFAPFDGPLFKGFDDWYGADIVVATGWQTVHPMLTLPEVRGRAYLIHDHETQFHATSVESYWAEETYGLGLHAITASPWLAEMARRHGATTSPFDFGVDHDVYRPKPVERRRDTVIFYAREITPRRAVPLGMLALQELRKRRPDVRFVLFGDLHQPEAPFDYEHLGIASPEQLAWAYSEATVGLCLSMTNYSLIPQEMLACGLPCVDLAGFSAETVFGADGPVELAPFDPVHLADAVERLLDNESLWDRRSVAGLEFVKDRTWDHAADQLEAGLREALRLREDEEVRRSLGAEDALDAWASPAAGTDRSVRAVGWEPPRSSEATDLLYGRLDPEDLAPLDELVQGDFRALWDTAGPIEHKQFALAFGVWFGLPGVLAKTGLRAEQPPEGVHAMARGVTASGGSYYDADMVAEAVTAAGQRMTDVRRALDFGCSSGRAVRALAAAWPDVEWHGVDPNAEAVAWASEHLSIARFAQSPTEPPLPYADASFDLAYAISIWSHFDDGAALAWLDEMHRVLRPDGLLVMTVHSYRAIEYAALTGERPARQLDQIRHSLYRRGFWFAPEFGEAGDHGVKHSAWGTSFMTAEWLAARVAPKWLIAQWAVGRNSANQDVVTLIRRP